MPLYSATALCTSISPGDTTLVWSAETVLSGQASSRITLAAPYGDAVAAISIEIAFSAAPGTFEIDVQEADTDAEVNYLNIPVAAVINAVDAAKFTARVDLSPFSAKFVRLNMKTQPANAVTVTGRVTLQ